MNNQYIEQIIADIENGKEVSLAKCRIVRAYQSPNYNFYGRICVSDSLHTAEDAVELAQQLSLAGIKDLYITGEWSNQLAFWFAIDAFGMKLSGIEMIENGDYRRDVAQWGSSFQEPEIPALKFSFEVEK